MSGVQSVDRALDVLEVLVAQGTSGVTDIVRATGLPLGTVHRLLATLAERGYVRQDADRRYAVGPAALRLVDPSRQSIAAVGTPYIRRLTAQFEETANLAVREGEDMVYVAQSPSPHSLRIFAEVGRRVPLYRTAVGKAILATYDDREVATLLSGMPMGAATRHTITGVPAMLAELAKVRAQGFAVDEQEQEIGVRCVAAAVPTPSGPSFAAISLSGPTERFSVEGAAHAGPTVRQRALELGEALHG